MNEYDPTTFKCVLGIVLIQARQYDLLEIIVRVICLFKIMSAKSNPSLLCVTSIELRYHQEYTLLNQSFTSSTIKQRIRHSRLARNSQNGKFIHNPQQICSCQIVLTNGQCMPYTFISFTNLKKVNTRFSVSIHNLLRIVQSNYTSNRHFS